MTELLDHARRVAAAVQIPILADIDDGGGTPLSVRRTIRLAEQVGLAAVHVEDLVPGKHL
jgi:2-methylisocitrate lyase-like PEP mutase family enzyme